MLRSTPQGTLAAAARDAALSESEWRDIGRYLDATRAELVFSRKVLLVEGYAESVLCPTLAQDVSVDLDQLGITVCAVNGIHFLSYIKFCNALAIPWAVITDGDPRRDGTKAGEQRVQRIAKSLGLTGTPTQHGVFAGKHTFEYDLAVACDENFEACKQALQELSSTNQADRISEWQQLPDFEVFMAAVNGAGGKGRFAQRLASE